MNIEKCICSLCNLLEFFYNLIITIGRSIKVDNIETNEVDV